MSQRKLEEILKALEAESYLADEENRHEYDDCREKARSAILELFKSTVPESHSNNGVIDGAWNCCRTETLRNMELI